MTNKRRVVLIDNNVVDRLLVKGIMDDLGLELIIVDDVENALKQSLNDRQTGLILLNIPQGKRSYEDSIDELRRDNRVLPIVGIMSYGAKNYIKSALETGLSDYIVRPLERETIIKKMKPYLGFEKAA